MIGRRSWSCCKERTFLSFVIDNTLPWISEYSYNGRLKPDTHFCHQKILKRGSHLLSQPA